MKMMVRALAILLALAVFAPGVGLTEGELALLPINSDVEYAISCIEYDGALYLLMADGLYQSGDGDDWQMVDFELPDDFGDYEYLMLDRERALFMMGGSSIYLSADGAKWSAAEGLPEWDYYSGQYRHFIEFGGCYLLFTSDYQADSREIYRSEDGASWEVAYTVEDGGAAYSGDEVMNELGGRLVLLMRDGKALITGDGIEYSVVDITGPEGEGLVPSDLYVCLGEFIIAEFREPGSYESRLYVSNDAESWRPLAADGAELPPASYVFYNPHGAGQLVFHDDDTEFTEFSNAMPGGQAAQIAGISWEDFVRHDDYLTAKSPETSFAFDTDTDAEFGGREYRVYAGQLQVKNEAGEFLRVRGGTNDLKEAASDGAGSFVASGYGGELLIGKLSGGALETEYYNFNPDGSGIKMLDYQNDNFWLCTNAGGLYSSTDGRTFTGRAALTHAAAAIIHDGERYLAATDGGIMASADGESWELIYESDYPLKDIALAGGKYLACGVADTLVVSDDLVNFAVAELPDTLTSNTLYTIAYGEGRYLIGGGTGSGGRGVMFSSEDGADWVQLTYGPEGYAPAQNGDLLYENCSYAIRNVGDLFVATGLNRISDGFIMTSPDGKAWEKQTAFWGKDITMLTDDILLMVGHYGVYSTDRVRLYSLSGAGGEVTLTLRGPATALVPENPVEVVNTYVERDHSVGTK